MKFIHALSRRRPQYARHPDGVRGNASLNHAEGIFGLSDPLPSNLDLRFRPTLAEVEAFQKLPDEEQLHCLNTYLRMAEQFSRASHYPDCKFVLTLQKGALRFAIQSPIRKKSGDLESAGQQIHSSKTKIFAQFFKDSGLKAFEVVTAVSKSTIYRNGKGDI